MKELQKNSQELQHLKQNWQQEFKELQIKPDMTQGEISRMGIPAISVLNSGERSTENGVKVFGLAVISIAEFMGAEWSELQCTDLSQILFSEYYYWTFAELKHFVLKVKNGDFGKVYGKFATNELMQYAASYNSEALVARASCQKQEAPPTPTDVEYVSTDRIKDAFSRFADEWKQNIRNQSAARNEEEKRQKEAQKEKLLRQYCLRNGLDFDLMKSELQNHAA